MMLRRAWIPGSITGHEQKRRRDGNKVEGDVWKVALCPQHSAGGAECLDEGEVHSAFGSFLVGSFFSSQARRVFGA